MCAGSVIPLCSWEETFYWDGYRRLGNANLGIRRVCLPVPRDFLEYFPGVFPFKLAQKLAEQRGVGRLSLSAACSDIYLEQ